MRRSLLPGTWDDLIVICAGTPWDGVPFPEHHIAERLAADHAAVLYVDPPTSLLAGRRDPARRLSLEEPRLRLVAPRLARLTPVVLPGPERAGIRATTPRLVRMWMRRAVRTLGGNVAAVVLASQHELFGACGEHRRVVFATDDLVAGAELLGVAGRHLEAQVRRQADRADLVVGVSEVICEAWRARGAAVALVPNGVDVATFRQVDAAPLPPDVDLPSPIVGFVGHLSERIDVASLEAVAARGCSLLLVGPRQPTFELARLDSLLARDNVRWVGAKPFTALPSYLRVMDVGITPYRDTAFNRASFPLKTLEYLAAGRAAVASDLPALRWLDTELVSVAESASDLAERVAVELERPRTAALVDARQRFAAQHSWAIRAAEMAELLLPERSALRADHTIAAR